MLNFWTKIHKPIIGLSPMDGVTDSSFRYITAKHGGPDVTFTEFVNVETVLYAPHTLIRDLTYSEIERPVVAQIYGNRPELFYKVAHVVCELGFDGLDINMGCPAKKVVGSGGGAGLILNPSLARSIIRSSHQGIEDWCQGQNLSDLEIHPELSQRVKMSNKGRSGEESSLTRCPIPVSVKTRLGYDRVVVDEWMQVLLEERLSVISLHGRTLKQMYKGTADWEAIARAVSIAKNSGTLILGNGDLQDMHDVYRRVRETQVDGVLLGRSVQGNPWIFRDKGLVKETLRSPSPWSHHDMLPPIYFDERMRILLEHSVHFEKYSGAPSFVAMRKHLAWYCKASHRAAELRHQMVHANNLGDVVQCLKNYAALIASTFGTTGQAPLPWYHDLTTPDLQP